MRRLAMVAHDLVATWWRGSAARSVSELQDEADPPARRVWPDAVGPTAALRMAARFPHLHLLPPSPAIIDFATWASMHVPDMDPDGMMALYAEVCETAGWAPPPDADGAGSAAMPALPEKPEEKAERHGAASLTLSTGPASPVDDRAPTLMPALDPDSAARRFAEWVVENGRQGIYASTALAALYAEHAAAIHHEPTPQSSLRKALPRVPGISRGDVSTVAFKLRSQTRSERRTRAQHWKIYPQLEETELPFDLPYRGDISFRAAA